MVCMVCVSSMVSLASQLPIKVQPPPSYVESIKQNEVEIDSHIRRDQPVEILGKALNTTYRIEIQSEGQSLDPPIYIDLPSLGVSVADNGTRIYIASNTFQS